MPTTLIGQDHTGQQNSATKDRLCGRCHVARCLEFDSGQLRYPNDGIVIAKCCHYSHYVTLCHFLTLTSLSWALVMSGQRGDIGHAYVRPAALSTKLL